MFQVRLKELREKAGYSQQGFADAIGVKQSTVGNWEAGAREPKFEIMERLADFFGVSVDYLLGKTDDPTPSSTEMTEEEKNILGLLHKMSEDELKTVYKITSAMAGEE